jgi:ribonuclease D
METWLTMPRMSRNHAATPPSELVDSISRDALNELPIRRYAGPVHVVARHSELEPAMQDILAEGVVGFDTETRPAFRPGESYLPSLVQFATASAVYLLRVQQPDLFEATREILASERIVKAGVSVTDDLRNLKRLFEFEARSVVDLGQIAERVGLRQTGLRNLAGMFLGARIPKGAKTTNWAARHLTPQQIVYAATDAWVCRELYMRFRELKMV